MANTLRDLTKKMFKFDFLNKYFFPVKIDQNKMYYLKSINSKKNNHNKTTL